MQVTAALAVEPGRPLRIEGLELDDELRAHEVLVRNVATGICRTDLTFRDMPPEAGFMPRPAVLGHEGAGVVERVGPAVTTLRPGDHVIMSYHYDGTCSSCRERRHPYCDAFVPSNVSGFRLDGSRTLSSARYEHISGSFHQQSSFATYSIATDTNAIKVPPELALEYLGPLGCSFLTGTGAIVHRLKPRSGSSLAVFGMGPLGFAALVAAKQAGCAIVIAVDVHASRLRLARELGATHTVNGSQGDAVGAILEVCPAGVDYSYEAAGVVTVMTQAVAALAPHGHCVLSGGVSDFEARFEVAPSFFLFDKTVSGVLMGHADMPGTVAQLVDATRTGALPIERLARIYDFADINQAMADSAAGTTIKAIVRMPT